MINNPRGSLWHRWDLHVHTPYSIVHHYPGTNDEAWEAFLSDLEGLPSDFKVVGINDYMFLDGYERVLKERAGGRLQNIDLILPVVELRLNSFGGTESSLSRVNYHVIFSDELDVGVLKEQFISALSSRFELTPRVQSTAAKSAWKGSLSKAALADFGEAIIESVPEAERKHYGSALVEGFNNLTISHEKLREVLDSSFLRGRYVTGVGKTEWADIKWKDGSIADKKHLINSAECVFISAYSPGAYSKARAALIDAGVNSKLLDCSDSHYLSSSGEKDRIGNGFTWVKADVTFGGLLQALQEFDRRVFVGDEPPQNQRMREHPSKYIDRVYITKTSASKLYDTWFSVDVPLNGGLVAIIGNKGSGKSALAEAMGLASATDKEDHFSFLAPSKFRDSRQRLADSFESRVFWRDGEVNSAILSDRVEPGAIPKVQHLPQRYLESLCTEIPRGEKTQFDEELERIIYAHLPVDEQLGARTLDELITVKTAPLDTEIEGKRKKLTQINTSIAQLEHDGQPETNRAKYEAYRDTRREWLSLKANPPEEVLEPDASSPDFSAIREKLQELNTAIGHLERLKAALEASLSDVRRDQADLANFRSEIEAIERMHSELYEENEEFLRRLDLYGKASSLTVRTDLLDQAREKLAKQVAGDQKSLGASEEDKGGIRRALKLTNDESEKLRSELSAPEEAREKYLKRFAEWKQEVRNLLGERGTIDPKTLLGARNAFLGLRKIPDELSRLRDERLTISMKIHELLLKKAKLSADLYEPLQRFMDDQELPSEYELTIGTDLVDQGFSGVFLDEYLNRNLAGSFCGVQESQNRLTDLLNACDLNDSSSVEAFLKDIGRLLRQDVRHDPPTPTHPAGQIRKGKTIKDLYAYVYGLDFLSPRYGLRFGGKPVYQLSPGEKGTLLLIFFLVAEVDTRPLIVDQPEDNLDNNTVYRALVRCFQQAKEHRQVIMVTHNPNLAVVCDADQIIVASMAKSGGNMITYDPGAIEHPKTARSVVDILEGTHPAFENRSIKYNLHLMESD